jgi:hypothetical protein
MTQEQKCNKCGSDASVLLPNIVNGLRICAICAEVIINQRRAQWMLKEYEIGFGVSGGPDGSDPRMPWIVSDAECESVAYCPSEEVALFICHLLNKTLIEEYDRSKK